MDEPTETELASMSIDTELDGWEELYNEWQDENVASFRTMYGERVGTIHVTRVPDDPSLPGHAIFTLYAELNPGE